MNDRELLELAAKAAGIDARILAEDNDGTCGHWNPLDDDGDALRLGVALALTIHQWPCEVCVCNEKGTINESEPIVEDVLAATRRSIVRAAAEIGKSMA